jgi:hypothetical protein
MPRGSGAELAKRTDSVFECPPALLWRRVHANQRAIHGRGRPRLPDVLSRRLWYLRLTFQLFCEFNSGCNRLQSLGSYGVLDSNSSVHKAIHASDIDLARSMT